MSVFAIVLRHPERLATITAWIVLPIVGFWLYRREPGGWDLLGFVLSTFFVWIAVMLVIVGVFELLVWISNV